MSIQAMSWVIEKSVHKGNAFVVLLMIANHAKEDGAGAWPSIATIAKKARIGERTVQRVIASLVQSGELNIDSGSGPKGTNLYTVNMGCQNDTPGGAKCAGGGVTALSPGGCHSSVTRTVLEPSLEPKTSLSSTSSPTEFFLNSNPPQKKKKSKADPRHRIFMDLIFSAHSHYVQDVNGNPSEPMMGGAAGKNLSKLLIACPKLDEAQMRRWLTNYHKSNNHNEYDTPSQYILKLPRYEGGPLNGWGRRDATS